MIPVWVYIVIMVPLTIIAEWSVVYFMVKTGRAFKFLPKPDPNKYNINMSNEGIDLHLPGQDPIQAVNNLVKKITGADKSMDEKLDNMMDGYINEKMKDVLVQNLKDKGTDDAITQLIQKKIKEKLENIK